MAAHGTATGRESRSVMSTLGRTIASVALVSAALSISGSPHTLAADASPTGSVDVSGITIVGPGTIQARATSDTQALAFDAALSLALKYPDDFGYPWIDPNTNTLELSTVNAAGASRAEDVETRSPIADEQSRNTIAGASISKLMAITDEVTALGDEFPNDHLIWMIEPDQQHNRIVISISQRNEDLLKGLADKFGTELIEVRVAEAKLAGTMNRNSDNPSFWGGAKIFVPGNATCTTGFAWKDGTQFAMLTAAHCASTGGNISYLNYPNAGSVRGGYEENWLAGTGTVYYQGQRASIAATSLLSGIQATGPDRTSTLAVLERAPTERWLK